MKARVKATGKLLENVIPIMSVDNKLVMFHEYGTDNEYYYYEELDFSNVIDLEQARIQAAIAAMQGQLANDESVKQMIETLDSVALPDKTKAYMNLVARSSVMLADALVAELKKGGQDE